jgi:signal transduction histidine kinase
VSAPAVQTEQTLPGGGEVLVNSVRYGVAATLMDSLLHDARNPLNALAINLEVLTEKLRLDGGQLPASHEKNLKAMREQIGRMDGLLRQFADFMAPRPCAPAPVPLSETVLRGVEVLGHECRRKRLKVRLAVDAELVARPAEPGAVRFIVMQVLVRAFRRAEADSEVSVTLRRAGAGALLEVEDGAGAAAEPVPEVLTALELEADKAGARVQVRGPVSQVDFSLS